MPETWAKAFKQKTSEKGIAARLCNRDYEGDIKEIGDKVIIKSAYRPPVVYYNDANGLGDFERGKERFETIEITEGKEFRFFIGNEYEYSETYCLNNAELTKMAAALAVVMDSYIYSHYKEAGNITTVDIISTDNILSVIHKTLVKLWNNNVPTTETVSLEVTPEFMKILQMAKLLVDTDGTTDFLPGFPYGLKVFNVDVYMSHSLPREGTKDICVLRTKNAISFAEQLNRWGFETSQSIFGVNFKGEEIYGAKVVRPEELAVIKIESYRLEDENQYVGMIDGHIEE